MPDATGLASHAAAQAEPTRLVLIRHGETRWNAEGRLQGHQDSALSPLGQRQAARLADALRHEGLQRVVSSDLQRAWHTAQALATPLGLPLQAEPGLRERCFGQFEGLTRREIEARWPEDMARWLRREPDFAPAGAESLAEFFTRCTEVARRLAQQHAGQTIALVCHGGVLDCLYRAATGQSLDAPRSWQLGNTSINRLLYTGSRFSLVGWNDQTHLDQIPLDELS